MPPNIEGVLLRMLVCSMGLSHAACFGKAHTASSTGTVELVNVVYNIWLHMLVLLAFMCGMRILSAVPNKLSGWGLYCLLRCISTTYFRTMFVEAAFGMA